VFWQAAVDPGVLLVSAHRRHADSKSDNDAIDFSRLDAEVTVLKLASGLEHVRITHGPYAIQLEVVDGSVLHGTVHLTYHIDGFGALKPKILTLQRLSAFRTFGRFPVSLFAPDARTKRLFFALRALDMVQAGLSHREIAEKLFADESWSNKNDWVRSRVRRVLATAQKLSEGGYLGILGGGGSQPLPYKFPRPPWPAHNGIARNESSCAKKSTSIPSNSKRIS
jgi:hypothetical protein